MVRTRAASTWPIAASVIRNRNGISLIISPAISASPSGSWTMMRSGGRSYPVSQGEVRRKIQPEGASRNASPNATVTWGIDRSGERNLCTQAKDAVPCQPAKKRITTAKERAVTASPVTKERRIDSATPGAANSARHGSRLNVTPPSAGR